jgi:prolyl 4-hydroxylase
MLTTDPHSTVAQNPTTKHLDNSQEHRKTSQHRRNLSIDITMNAKRQKHLLLVIVLMILLHGNFCEEDMTPNSTCSNEDDTCRIDSKPFSEATLDCQDENEKCEIWAQQGECEANSGYMLQSCKQSCSACPDQEDAIAKGIEIGVLQELTDLNNATESYLAMQLIQRSKERMEELKSENIISKELLDSCRNNHESCTLWALRGECEKNPGYMYTNCAPVCQNCEFLDVRIRCPPYDPEVTPGAWQPGDLNAMFERLSAEPYLSQYQVEVLSRDPWVITMENVLNSTETARLIELSSQQGFKRSSGTGKAKPDGTFESLISASRTSSNSWCNNDCFDDPTAASVIERLSNITQIPKNNSEALQMLRYEVGEFYKSHHDYLLKGAEKQPGVRILTMYLYLNNVEKGGGTKFNELNITVTPKQGRALLWPSVLNDSPHEKDSRTVHEALPVEEGVKYGTNAWFHQYDFRTPYNKGCSG